MFFKEPLTECFFVEPNMVPVWHRLKHLYFKEWVLVALFLTEQTISRLLG